MAAQPASHALLSKDGAKNVLAVVGAAALSVSLFHSLKSLWKTYEQRVHNKRLEEYPPALPAVPVACRLPALPGRAGAPAAARACHPVAVYARDACSRCL